MDKEFDLFSDESESSTDVKEEIRTDVYTTEEEAEERAEEIGCVGTHSHDDNGNLVFMPCRTHAEYIERVGRDVNYRKPDDDDEDMKTEYLNFEFKSVYDDDDEKAELAALQGQAMAMPAGGVGGNLTKIEGLVSEIVQIQRATAAAAGVSVVDASSTSVSTQGGNTTVLSKKLGPQDDATAMATASKG